MSEPTYPHPPVNDIIYQKPLRLLFDGDPVGRRLQGGWIVEKICEEPGLTARFGSSLDLIKSVVRDGEECTMRTTASAYYLLEDYHHYIEPETEEGR